MKPYILIRLPCRKDAWRVSLLRVPYLGRIGSTKLELPKWHKYGTLNRVIRVIILQKMNVWLAGHLIKKIEIY